MIIQKRVVYDIFMMFGEVGGLYDFYVIFLAFFFGFFSEHFLVAELVQKLFRRISTERKNQVKAMPSQPKRAFKSFLFPPWFILAQACTKGKCPRDKKMQNRALNEGIARVKDSLDIVKLIR